MRASNSKGLENVRRWHLSKHQFTAVLNLFVAGVGRVVIAQGAALDDIRELELQRGRQRVAEERRRFSDLDRLGTEFVEKLVATLHVIRSEGIFIAGGLGCTLKSENEYLVTSWRLQQRFKLTQRSSELHQILAVNHHRVHRLSLLFIASFN